MSDFIGGELLEIEVHGRKFKIKEADGEEYDRMSEKYVLIDSEGNVNVDIAKRSKEFLGLVVEAPDDYVNADGKKFPELTKDERVEILQRLKPKLRDSLIGAINRSMGIDEGLKKK